MRRNGGGERRNDGDDAWRRNEGDEREITDRAGLKGNRATNGRGEKNRYASELPAYIGTFGGR